MDYFRNPMGPAWKCLYNSVTDKRNMRGVELSGGSAYTPKA